MSLSELTAQEIARIDAVSIEFEKWLGEQLAGHLSGVSTSPESGSGGEQPFSNLSSVAKKIDFRAAIDRLIASNSADLNNVLQTELRRELEAVANEMLSPKLTATFSDSGPAPTTILEGQTPGPKSQPSKQKTSKQQSPNSQNMQAKESVAGDATSIMPGNGSSDQVQDSSGKENVASGWLQPGMQIGPYLIDRRIGRGGMGEVYRGRDVRLGRDVAIKVLVHDWSDSPEHADRFDREARAVATLSHPSIVSLYDVGHHSGRPYAVMELLRGETLRDRLRKAAPLDPSEVRTIGIAAANALDVAHQAGIIHRDLKPENLFLTSDERIKLLDFGLSRSRSDAAGGSDPTITGMIMGTMGYLSPEQAVGKNITPAADLFSLGCVLHECFYGIRPFRGETTNESLAATINAQPRVDQQRAAVDPVLARLIAQCLEKAPENRPASAKILALELGGETEAARQIQSQGLRALAGEQAGTLAGESASIQAGTQAGAKTVARADSGLAGSGLAVSRRNWLRAAGMSAASLAGAGALYGGWRWLKPSRNIRSIAVLPLSNAGPAAGAVEGLEMRALDEGEQISAAIADQLTRIPDLRVVPFLPLREVLSPQGGVLPQGLAAGEQIDQLAEQLGVDALLMGSFSIDPEGFRTIEVLLVEGRSGSQIGRYKVRAKREENLIKQEETAEKVAAGIGRELLAYRSGRPHENGTYHCLVNGYSRMDSESVGALRDAIKCFKNAIGQDEKFAEAYSGLALTSMILVSQVGLDERTELIAGARKAIRSAIDLGDTTGLAQIAESMVAWQVDWDFSTAAQLFRRYVPGMPGNWVAQHEYAFFLAAEGDFIGAQRHADRAVGLDPTSTAFRIDAARLRWFSGDWRSALAEMRATAVRATGTRLDLVRGATLDLLESVGMWNEAQSLLLDSSETFSPEVYWPARESALAKQPYGPYDNELNLLLLRIRRGDDLDSQTLSEIKLHRPPRLPFLLATHPTLVPFKGSKIFEEANVRV